MAKRNKNKKFKKKPKTKTNTQEEINFMEDYFNKVNKSRKCVKAKEYLSAFESDRESWKFNKMVQIFILNHILIKEIFSKEFFEIFKTYFNKMSESSKKSFYDQCVKYVQNFKEGNLYLIKNTNLKFKDEDKENKIKEIFHKRCVQLIENC